MTEAEFTAEQDYVRERLRRHNRALHGVGVVRGLELAVVGDSAPPLEVRPVAADGLQTAVDCAAPRAGAEAGAAGDRGEGGQLFGLFEFPEDGGDVLGAGGGDGHGSIADGLGAMEG